MLRRLVTILLLTLATAEFQLSNTMNNSELYLNDFFQKILINFKDIRTLLIKRSISVNCPLQNLMERSGIPMVLQNLTEDIALKPIYNQNVLALVCLRSNFTVDMINGLLANLQHMRSTKTIFFIASTESKQAFKIRQLFEYCYSHKMLHTLALFEDFESTLFVYAYRAFPHFQLLSLSVNTTDDFFPDRFDNLYGQPLLTLPDQHVPHSMVYYDSHGKQVLTGYVGKFMQLLATKLNASLKYPFAIESGKLLHFGELLQLTRTGILDVPTSIMPIWKNVVPLHYYSYPFEFMRTCLMIPLARAVPLRDVFRLLFDKASFLITVLLFYSFSVIITLCQPWKTLRAIDLLLNDVVLRGILGQPFSALRRPTNRLKFIYMLLFISGLYIGLFLSAYLQTLLTSAPLQHQIRTFLDSYVKALPILLSDKDFRYFENVSFPYINSRLHIRVTDLDNFYKMRNTFNTSYAYPVENMRFGVYKQQQQYFGKDLFIFSEEACLVPDSFLCFILQENSPFRAALDKLILDIRAHGLIDRWFRLSFNDMIEAKIANVSDLTQAELYASPLLVDDLLWIWLLFLVLSQLSFLVFIVEIVCGRKRK